jgi:two-component system sensor histidine kinase SenX3
VPSPDPFYDGAMARPWLKSAREAQHSYVAPELLAVLENLDSISILFSGAEGIIHSSSEASQIGIVRNGRVVSEELLALIRVVRRTGQAQEGHIELPTTGISEKVSNLRVRVVPLNERGMILLLIDDVSEAERVDAVRRDFVANISHELKTPIGALSLLSEAVAASSDDPEMVRHFAGKMSVTAKRLTELVQQIITLSKLQDTNPLREFELVDIGDLVSEAISQAQTNAESRQILLTAEISNDVNLFGDREQLVMAFHNLIENAINYSPEKTKVSISVSSDPKSVSVIVKDQGIGIPEGDLERIFERFYRVDPARSRETGGTGLGLSIVKHVASIHGGEVTVWSKPNEGSSFTMKFPRSLISQTEQGVQR